MLFRDEIVENIKQVTELRISDLLTDEEFIGRTEALLRDFRKARGFAPSTSWIPKQPELPPIQPGEPLFALYVTDPSEHEKRTEFDRREITIGRSSESDLILRKNDVSRRHAKILLKDGYLILLDLQSENGTYVNGERISSPHVLKANDIVAIGDYKIQIDAGHQEKTVQ